MLSELQPKKRRVPLIKPQSSGLVERALVVGGGLSVAYTFAATLPIASIAALVGMGAYFLQEVNTFQPRDKAEELRAIFEAQTPLHPSLKSLRSTLRKQYPTEVVNAAIESMLGHTGLVVFNPGDTHPLARFGQAYCWINPHDPTDVQLPVQRLEELLRQWGVMPTVATDATPVPAPAAAVEAAPNPDATSTPATGARQSLATLYPQFRFRPTLLWGGQGSGKTTLAKAIAADKVANGQQVVVVNPHGSRAAWDGLLVIGSGRNYAAISAFLEHYIELINQRYQQFNASGLQEDEYLQQVIDSGQACTVICEEMSGWAHQLDQELLHEFAQTALTESRKVGLPPLFVTHDPSLRFLGLKKGARLRDEGMVIVALDPGLPDAQGILKGTGQGTLQLPQQKPIPFQFAPVTVAPQPNPVPQSAIAELDDLLMGEPAPVAVESKPPMVSEPTPPRSPVERLEQAYKLSAPDEFPTEQQPTDQPPELPFDLEAIFPEMRPIAQYSARHGWVKAIDIKRNVRAFKGISTEVIREYFLILKGQGCGTCRGEAEMLEYSALG